MKKVQHNLLYPRILFVLGICCIFSVELFQRFSGDQTSSRVDEAQSVLLQLNNQLIEDVGKVMLLHDEDAIQEFFIETGKQNKGISYYILQGDKLVRWSDNEPVLSDSLAAALGESEYLHLPNGQFISRSAKLGSKKVVGLLLLRHDYAYENRYLKNEFNPALKLSPWLVLTDTSNYSLKGPDRKTLFHLAESPQQDCRPFSSMALLYILGIVFLLFSFVLSWRRMLSQNPKQAAMLIITMLVLRLLMIIFKIPEELYGTDLFSPQNYASSFFFNSLGDLLLNALLIGAFSAAFYLMHGGKDKASANSKYKFPVLIILLLLFIFFIHYILEGLVMNSRISFDMTRFSSLESYTLLAFSCMALLMMSLVLFLVGIFRKYAEKYLKFGGIILILIVSSVYTAFIIDMQNRKKEQESRKLFAQKVDARQDHVAEYLFNDLEAKISADSIIQTWLSGSSVSSDRIQQYLSLNYFVGYLAKFDLTVFSFDSAGHSIDKDRIQDSLAYFLKLSQDQGKKTISSNLFYLNDENGRLTYLAILPVHSGDNSRPNTLVIWLAAKFFQSDAGFPELFISAGTTEKSEPNEYSVAAYKNGELVYEYGNYAYSFSSKELEGLAQGSEFICLGNYSHLLHRSQNGDLVIVSISENGSLTLLTLFSWIFAFYSLFFSLNYFILRLLLGVRLTTITLTRRIQVSIILLVVASFILIGSGTLLYILKKYESDQQRSISGQVNGLWFLLGNNIGFQSPLSKIPPESRRTELNELVRDLNLDFNLYDEQGYLFYSSQPKIFEQKIISSRMNSLALYEIRKKGRTQYINPESAGKLKYISAYSPFTDRKGQVTGFLNLPYFEKQNELNREISGFLSALINIYVLLFALAVLVTLFISSRITKPLLLIQSKLSSFRLGKRNEPIQYHRNDEIGQLVHEYNRVLDELTLSAERLAQSERESAWREMAKQVAHEIKNPLTPMKLSIQHLQRVWNEDGADKELLVDKMAKTIIQQIDTLSNIATEFSNFAKMPEAKLQELDVRSVLESAVSLFRDTPDITLHFESYESPLQVIADPDQLRRVFSNLLKNAVQSIPANRKGQIRVEIVRDSNDYCTIKISDNGIGIPDNQKDKIFSPNFTTKSSGMGLGLSMVKNMVQIAGGTIWFTSEYDQGTSFHIRLPLVN